MDGHIWVSEYPIRAQVIQVRQNDTFRDAVLIWVRCPICGKVHQHGARKDWDGGPSSREPHCFPPANKPRIGYSVCIDDGDIKGPWHKLLPVAWERWVSSTRVAS